MQSKSLICLKGKLSFLSSSSAKSIDLFLKLPKLITFKTLDNKWL
jgi:hypothetical protein